MKEGKVLPAKSEGRFFGKVLGTLSVPDTRYIGCRQSGSNRRPLDYETNATTNCAIAADQALIVD